MAIRVVRFGSPERNARSASTKWVIGLGRNPNLLDKPLAIRRRKRYEQCCHSVLHPGGQLKRADGLSQGPHARCRTWDPELSQGVKSAYRRQRNQVVLLERWRECGVL